jgi:hypothetical protein
MTQSAAAHPVIKNPDHFVMTVLLQPWMGSPPDRGDTPQASGISRPRANVVNLS